MNTERMAKDLLEEIKQSHYNLRKLVPELTEREFYLDDEGKIGIRHQICAHCGSYYKPPLPNLFQKGDKVIIKNGSPVWQDWGKYNWPDKKENKSLVFEVRGYVGNSVEIVTKGYGIINNREDYGNGSLFVTEKYLTNESKDSSKSSEKETNNPT